MVKIIDEQKVAAAQKLSDDVQLRLKAEIDAVFDRMLQGDEQAEPEEWGGSILELGGSMATGKPKPSDEAVAASIAEHIKRENPRPGG